MEFLEIHEMDNATARNYLLAVITTLKQTERKAAEIKEQVVLWKKRTQLAKDNNRSDLEDQSRQRVDDLEAQLAGLLNEITELGREKIRVNDRLKMTAFDTEFEVDAEQLADELAQAAGEPDLLASAFKEEAANAELSKLKKRLNSEDS